MAESVTGCSQWIKPVMLAWWKYSGVEDLISENYTGHLWWQRSSQSIETTIPMNSFFCHGYAISVRIEKLETTEGDLIQLALMSVEGYNMNSKCLITQRYIVSCWWFRQIQISEIDMACKHNHHCVGTCDPTWGEFPYFSVLNHVTGLPVCAIKEF